MINQQGILEERELCLKPCFQLGTPGEDLRIKLIGSNFKI